ncbi:MAG: RNB domain-containing ribonuclease [Opitutales bacterium]|nr:RNB domain-containing ribonuclease [Opitutales bacterium]
MDLEEKILELLKRGGSAMKAEEIYDRIGGKQTATFSKLKKTFPRLLRAGRITCIKGNRYCIPQTANLYIGHIFFSPSGTAKFFADKTDGTRDETCEPVRILPENTKTALHGDRVEIRIDPPKKRPKRDSRGRVIRYRDDCDYGTVIKILERAITKTTGTYRVSRYGCFVTPDDPHLTRDISVPAAEQCRIFPLPRDGDKVAVELQEWEHQNEAPRGEVVEVLGAAHTPMAEYKGILYRYDLNPTFPQEVCNQVAQYGDSVPEKELKGRLDCRKIFTVTIDPDDAKDFDDALSLENLSDGTVRVGIHIADVSHYVATGTPLDIEARSRGNSTYLVGTVVPMLPHRLSSGLCSLMENETRLCKSVFVTFDADAQIVKTEFANTAIRSDKRLNYGQALAILQGADNKTLRALPAVPAHISGHPGRRLDEVSDAELDKMREHVTRLGKIAKKLRERRMLAGALDLNSSEVKIYCDADGYADEIVKIEQDESHQLVEEFMLVANEAVATVFSRERIPYIARVHDKPEPSKLKELREDMLAAGIKTGDLSKREEIIKLLGILKSRSDGYVLRIRFLKSMKQACYRARADGHYGLAKTYYAHFTSPIRRYADLTVHRALDFYLQKNHLPTAASKRVPAPQISLLAGTAEQISDSERKSVEAERDSQKIKLLEFFDREARRKEKRDFEAVITDFSNKGILVELVVSQAFGMVRFSTLNDFFKILDDRQRVLGSASRRQFRIGQHIRVCVAAVDHFMRTIDFTLAGTGKKTSKIRR